MAEFEMSWKHNNGPKIDSGSYHEKLYTLLSLFLASKEVAAHCDDEIGCQVTALRDEFEQSFITRLLIECAVAMRIKDDLFEQQHGMASECEKDLVGELRSPSEGGTVVPLSLRESCNKIIHANQINFDVYKDSGWHCRFLNPTVYLYGTRGSTRWKAELDIVKWVEFGASMFP